MKKYLLSSIVLTLLLSGVVYAETSSANSNVIGNLRQKNTDVKQNMQETRASAKSEIASSASEIKTIRQEIKDAIEIRIGKKLDEQKTKIANNFENAVRNEKDLIMRTQSRIYQISLQGVDVASSSAFLEKAKTQVSLAETELAKLENLLVQNVPSATSTSKTERSALLQSIKAQSEKTKTALKTAHATIVDVIASLKKGLMKKESTSTSTRK